MKRYLHICLDESGSSNEHYFIVGGFYIISKSSNKVEEIKNKIKSNIKKTELAIRKYRREEEGDKKQFIDPKKVEGQELAREIKWNRLSAVNKKFLTNELKSLGQKNIFIISDLFKWKNRTAKGHPPLDFIYNYSVRIMIERICILEGINMTDTLSIKLEIDQRADIPKCDDKGINTILHKARGLEEYLNTTFYLDKKMPNISVNSRQFDSKANALIRYADYVDGVVRGMVYFQDRNEAKNETSLKECYENIHRTIPCHCERLIRIDKGPIFEVENLCKCLNKMDTK